MASPILNIRFDLGCNLPSDMSRGETIDYLTSERLVDCQATGPVTAFDHSEEAEL